MLNAVQSRSVSSLSFVPTQAPVAAARPRVNTPNVLNPRDKVSALPAHGRVPTQVAFFVDTGSAALDQSLAKLNGDMRQSTFRDALASFRVNIRDMDVMELEDLQEDLLAEIQNNTSYRAQKLLHLMRVDLYLEIKMQDGDAQSVDADRLPVPGRNPKVIVKGSLNQLRQNMSESHAKAALASFRVGIRQFTAAGLEETLTGIAEQKKRIGDYRSQVFLESIESAVLEEQIMRGIDVEAPALKMPPRLGRSAAEILPSALALLKSSPSEENFQTSIAAFRVATRNLDATQKNLLKTMIQTAMKSETAYRTQVYLDQISFEI